MRKYGTLSIRFITTKNNTEAERNPLNEPFPIRVTHRKCNRNIFRVRAAHSSRIVKILPEREERNAKNEANSFIFHS